MAENRENAKLDVETVLLIAGGLGAIEEARKRIPMIAWQLASIVNERVDPETSEVTKAAVERADELLVLFEPSGEPKETEDVLAIARAQERLEGAVRLLLSKYAPREPST